MSDTIQTQNAPGIPIFNGLLPKQKPRVMPIGSVSWASGSAWSIDLSDVQGLGRLDFVQCCYIDNSQNSAGVTLTVGSSGQAIVCPGACQGYFPLLVPNPPLFTLASASGAGGTSLFFINAPLPACVWNPTAPNPGTNPVINGVPASRSVVTVANTSTMLCNANAARKYLLIGAPQTAGVWIRFGGGAASPNGTDCFYLAPGAMYQSQMYVPSGQVDYYCTTAGLELPCVEG